MDDLVKHERFVMLAGQCGQHFDEQCWGCQMMKDVTDTEIRGLHDTIEALQEKVRVATEALERVWLEKAPSYHDCIDNGEAQCAWCDVEQALAQLRSPDHG